MTRRLDLDKSIYQNWHDANQENWDIPAIEYFGNQMTFAETDQGIDHYARSFRELQQNPESSVTFCVPTLPSMLMNFYALNKLGIRANFISDTLLIAGGPRYLDRANTETLIVLDKFYPSVAEAIARTSVKNVIVTSFSDNIENIPSQLPDKLKYVLGTSGVEAIKSHAIPGKEYFSMDDLLDISRGRQDFVESVYEAGKTSTILYTGGSTGLPKGIEKTDAEFVAMGNIYLDPASNLNLKAGERNGIFIPPNHPTSLVNSTIAQWFLGTTNVLQPIYNKLTFPTDVYGLNLDIAVAAPSHYAMFPESNLPDGSLRGFRLPICGGEAVNENSYNEINRALKRLGTPNPLTVAYGMSEVGPLTIMTVGRRTGKPVPGAEARLIGLDGNEIIGPGRGKLEVKAPTTHMKQYFEEPELTKKFWTVDGYAKTGDIAMRNADEEYDILGRGNDSFVDTNGETHYLFEIENFVYKNKFILEAEVVKLVVNSGSLEIPVVHLVTKGDASESGAEIIKQLHDACLTGLPYEERPYGYRLVNKFDTNPISQKRDYQSLKLVRDGFYNYDKQGLYSISFPEDDTLRKQYVDDSDIVVY
jgi:acyl-coenzyme A synthetase/AMP-(fatty) acid ligase